MIHLRGTEFAEFGVLLIKNSLLRASAVSSLLDRDNQNSHWEICANSENSQALLIDTLNSCQLRLERYFNTASANLAPGNQELLHLSSVKF